MAHSQSVPSYVIAINADADTKAYQYAQYCGQVLIKARTERAELWTEGTPTYQALTEEPFEGPFRLKLLDTEWELENRDEAEYAHKL